MSQPRRDLNVAQTLFAYETSSYDAVYSLAMAPDRDSLPNDLEAMKDLYIQLWLAMESSEHEKQRLVDQIRKHLRARFGRKAETMDPKQLMLAFAEMQKAGHFPPPETTDEPEPPQVQARRRIEKAGHGRRALPVDLPRVEVVHDIPDAEKTCACGKKMISLPPEVSEQLDYVHDRTDTNVEDGSIAHDMEVDHFVRAITFADKATAVLTGRSNFFALLDMRSGKLSQIKLEGPSDNDIYCVSVTSDGKQAYAGGTAGVATVDIKTRRVVWSDYTRRFVHGVAIAPRKDRWAYCALNGIVVVKKHSP